MSIVVPAFDEAARLPSTLARLLGGLDDALGPGCEVVVSDDGSTDATPDIVGELGDDDPRVRLVRSEHNRGKGAALVAGTAAATHPTVLFLDADLPVPLATLAVLVRRLDGADLVVGSRRLPTSSSPTPQPLVRRLGGRAFLTCVRLLGYRTATDPQCGVKVFDRDLLAPVLGALTCTGFALDVELIERASRAGLRVDEVPVEWSHVPGSSLRPVRDALSTLRDLARLRRRLGSGPPGGHRPTATLRP
ncbi:glycosyltransferase [Iamia majanohamensis]|uniref:Glycosyltransferase n=1 Tax=Iamia majanohamensis TaxID=467976 RepID=A0AAF0BSV7_9ACTN|nr:glycosyltransferase [Iamia majanohamensis]WCO65902.1 glycosyltransferase [Iamia majanohamensis]